MNSNYWSQFTKGASRLKWLGFDLWDLVTLLSLLACFLLVAKLPFAAQALGDMDFHIEAKTLSAALKGEENWTNVAMTNAPGPVLYYAFPYLFVKQGSSDRDYWRAAVVWTALWMGVSLLLLRRAAARVGGAAAGILAVLITLFNPFNIYYAFGVNAENPAYVGAVLMIAAWFWASEKEERSWSGVLGLSLGTVVFILSRPNGALILPLMALTAIVLARRGNRDGILLGRSVFVVVCLLAVMAFMVNQLPGRPKTARQGSYLAYVLFHGSFQYRTETWDWRFWGNSYRSDSFDYITWREELASLKLRSQKEGVPLASLQYRWVKDDFLKHPLVRLKMAAVRVLSLQVALVNSVKSQAFKLGPWHGPTAYWSFHIAINAINILVLGCAVGFAFRQHEALWSVWPLWVPFIALLAFHALFYAETRYLLPARPGLVVMAAAMAAGALKLRTAGRKGGKSLEITA